MKVFNRFFKRPLGHEPADGRFLFLHIPKTAGTSFRNMLYDVFDPNHVLPDKKALKANQGRYLRLDQLVEIGPERLSRYHLLAGHLPFVAADLFEEPLNVMVFLRDPVARAVSNLQHVRRMEHSGLSLEEVLEMPGELTRVATNLQTRWLSFTSIDEAVSKFNTLEPDRARLEKAKETLEKCAFVGITEQFDESIVLCERTFGWRFRTTGLKLNVTPPDDSGVEKFRSRIEECVSLDMELYDHARKLFRDRSSPHG